MDMNTPLKTQAFVASLPGMKVEVLIGELKLCFGYYGNAVANSQSERADEAISVFNALQSEVGARLAAAEERVPFAWQVQQGSRTFLVTAAEFTRSSYDHGSFKPLFE